jgi:hypothetical protein
MNHRSNLLSDAELDEPIPETKISEKSKRKSSMRDIKHSIEQQGRSPSKQILHKSGSQIAPM